MSSFSSLGAAAIGSSSSKKASEELTKAIAMAIAEQKRQFEIGREDQKPWRKAGQAAVNQLWERIQKGPGDFYEDPGYLFRRAEGEKALERSAAARGSVLSGAQLKAMERYNQDYASNEYTNFLNRYYNSLTPYQSMAGLGQTSVANQNAIGAQYSKMIGDNMVQGGIAQAAGYINQANSWMNAIKNASAGMANLGSMFGGGGWGGGNAIYDYSSYGGYRQPIYNSGDYSGAGSAGWSAPAIG